MGVEKISAKEFDATVFKEDEVILLKYGHNYSVCYGDSDSTKKYAAQNGLTSEQVFRNRVMEVVDHLLDCSGKGVVK